MRIAIVGTGIAGLTAAYHLTEEHEVTLFEQNAYIGGHTNTVSFDLAGTRYAVDTGFIVFNDRTYPNFVNLLDELGVESDETSMSFSIRSASGEFEYNSSSLNGLFAQRTNLLRPRFYRMLADILRFNRETRTLIDGDDGEDLTVAAFLTKGRFSRDFAERYLLPMGAAIWSCPPETFGNFPMRFIAEFYENHGLLDLRNRPTWRVIRGGSWTYVKAMTAAFRDSIRLNCPVLGIRRFSDRVDLQFDNGVTESFDEVVLACHSDQALKILLDASPVEEELLGAFPYGRNLAVLHTDTSVLPKRRRAWASWNYHLRTDGTRSATVTYNMNILQHIESQHVFCVTLNESDAIDAEQVIRRMEYSHPIYTTRRAAMQGRHHELIRENRTSFCGAYWGNGFHEDGVNSALAVCRAFQQCPVRLTDQPGTEGSTTGVVA